MRYDTGAGLTEGVLSERGLGQGTMEAPSRALLLLGLTARAVDTLVA